MTTFVGGLSFTSHTSLLASATTGGAATTMTFLTAITGFGIPLAAALVVWRTPQPAVTLSP